MSNKFDAIVFALAFPAVFVDFLMNPGSVVGDSRVNAGEIGRRASDAPTGDAGQHEALLAGFHVLTMNDERTAAVTLATVDAAGQETRANHVPLYQAF